MRKYMQDAQCARRRLGPQAGQALAEGLIVIALLAAFWLALGWLGRLQDIGLAAQHASSLAAFQHARSPATDQTATRHADSLVRYFSGPAHQWRDLQGLPLLPAPDAAREAGKRDTLSSGRADVNLFIDRATKLSSTAQPGGKAGHSAGLRVDWRIEDEGMLTASVQARTFHTVLGRMSAPFITRHTTLLSSAAHASTAAMASQRLAQSGLGWRSAFDPSQHAGRRLRAAIGDIDRAWSRPLPEFNWIDPWSGSVPAGLLRSQALSGHAGISSFYFPSSRLRSAHAR